EQWLIGGGRQFLQGDTDQLPLADLNITHNVIRYIQLPLSSAVTPPSAAPVWNSYEFNYSDNTVGGYGELSYMRTPTGSQYKYRYNLETEFQVCTGPCSSRDIAQHNSVHQKKISHDGLPDDFVWTYTIEPFVKTTVHNPDGGERV